MHLPLQTEGKRVNRGHWTDHSLEASQAAAVSVSPYQHYEWGLFGPGIAKGISGGAFNVRLIDIANCSLLGVPGVSERPSFQARGLLSSCHLRPECIDSTFSIPQVADGFINVNIGHGAVGMLSLPTLQTRLLVHSLGISNCVTQQLELCWGRLRVSACAA